MHRNQLFRQAFVAAGKPVLILASGLNLMNFSPEKKPPLRSLRLESQCSSRMNWRQVVPRHALSPIPTT